MRRIFNSKRNNHKMLFETNGIGFKNDKDETLWIGSAAKSNKSVNGISKDNLILILPTNKQIKDAGLNPSDPQMGQIVVFSAILHRLGLFNRGSIHSKDITLIPSTVKEVEKYSYLFEKYFEKFPENVDIKIPRFFIKNNETDIQFNIGVPLSYLVDFTKNDNIKNNWSNFTNKNKLYGNLLLSYEYEYENLSKDVKDTHAAVLSRVGLVGGNGTFSKSPDYYAIHGEELSPSGILNKARDTFKDYKDDDEILSNDESKEYFYESIDDDDHDSLSADYFSNDERPSRTRRSFHDELTNKIINDQTNSLSVENGYSRDDITNSSSVKNGRSTKEIRNLIAKYSEKAKKAVVYLLPIFEEAIELGIESPADFNKYASYASAVSSFIRDDKLRKLKGYESIYKAIFENEYSSIQEYADHIKELLNAASQERVKVNALSYIWKYAAQALNDIYDKIPNKRNKSNKEKQNKEEQNKERQKELFSRIVTPERIEIMSQSWDIPKDEISNCETILELLEVLYKQENLAKIYNLEDVDERPREKGGVRVANNGLDLKKTGRRVKNAENNKVIYDKEMVKAVDEAKIANLQAKFEKLKAEQEELGKKRLKLRKKLDSLDTLDPKYDEIEKEIENLNGEILRKSRNASSVKNTLNKLKNGVSHTRKQTAADKSVDRHDTLSGNFEELSKNFLDDYNVGNNDEEAKRRVIKKIRDKVGIKERKPDMNGLVNALQNSASNLTISFFVRSLNYKDTVPTSVRRQYVDKFINTFTKELNVRPEDYGSLFSVEDIPIKDMYEYSKNPKESDFYDSEEYNEPDKLDIKYRNGIEVRITYPKRGEFHKFLKKLLKKIPKAINNWLKKTTKSIINDENDIRVAYSKTIVEI